MEKIDMDEEFKQSFQHAMVTEKYIKMAIEYIVNTNPTEVILKNLGDTSDMSDVKERMKMQMQEWMGPFEAVLKEGRQLPVDLIGIASDIARRKREELK